MGLPGLVVRSLVLYSIAEAQAGHATLIRVRVEGRSFSVGDDGRGHAPERRVQGHPYLQLIYGQLAFPFDAQPGPPVQLQGIATSLIRGLCSEFCVSACREGVEHRYRFEDGAPQHESRALAPGETSGNTVDGVLRPELPEAPADPVLAGWLREAARAVPGLRIEFNGQRLDG